VEVTELGNGLRLLDVRERLVVQDADGAGDLAPTQEVEGAADERAALGGARVGVVGLLRLLLGFRLGLRRAGRSWWGGWLLPPLDGVHQLAE
jgi:hypothetical protein